MKVKVILSGLILIAFLFCLINHSQAAMDPWWQNRYPGEHPWQESDSPPIDDHIIAPETSSAIWIIGVPTKIIIIKVAQVKSEVKKLNKAASRIDLECSTK